MPALAVPTSVTQRKFGVRLSQHDLATHLHRVDEQHPPGPTRPTLLEEPLMTEDEVHALPVVVDLPTAARVLGLGRNTTDDLVRSGAWPTPVLRFGRPIKGVAQQPSRPARHPDDSEPFPVN